MFTTTISIDFLKRLKSMPNWAEMGYAFSTQLVPVQTVIDYAKAKLATDNAKNPDETIVASASTDESIAEPVCRLAQNDRDSSENEVQLFWANVLLAWAYEHRTDFDDLLSVVEKIYTDFGHPHELAQFVRYMPGNSPDLGSREANENGMIVSIGQYVSDYILPLQQNHGS